MLRKVLLALILQPFCNGQDGQEIEQTFNSIDPETLLTSLKIEGPTPCPSSPTIEGYSNITQMVIDLALTQIFNPMPATFTVCPNTIYNITTELDLANPTYHLPIIVPFDDITVNCGVDGDISNNCIFSGGFVHAVLGGSKTIINGFRFEDGEGVSVVSAGPSPFTAQFNNCIWKGNKGYGIFFNQMLFRSILEVVMDSESAMKLLPTSNDIAGLPPSLGEGMTVSFETCQFLENDVEIALMYTNHSTVVINSGLFEKNSAKLADIILQNESKGTISNTCFSEEQNRELGVIYVSYDSTLIPEGVSSVSTTEASYGCKDIFKESMPSDCLLNSTECADVKQCEEFQATSIEESACKAMSLPPPPTESGASNEAENPPEATAPASDASFTFVNIVSVLPLVFAWFIL